MIGYIHKTNSYCKNCEECVIDNCPHGLVCTEIKGSFLGLEPDHIEYDKDILYLAPFRGECNDCNKECGQCPGVELIAI